MTENSTVSAPLNQATNTLKFYDLTELYCRAVDNAFSLEKYTAGSLVLVGDEVTVFRRFRRNVRGQVIELLNYHLKRNLSYHAVKVAVKGKVRRVCFRRVRVESRRESYADHWAKVAHEDVGYFEELLKEDPFAELDEPTMVAFGATQLDFWTGMIRHHAKPQRRLATRFLDRACQKADYLISSRLIEKAGTPRHYVSRYAEILRCRAYASAILGNKLEQAYLIQAAKLIGDEAKEIPPFDWTGERQDVYLSAARMAIIADDMELARELLRSKRSFSQHTDQRRLLKKIARKSVPAAGDDQLREQCSQYLDFVRRPHSHQCAHFGGTWPELEWGAIVECVFNSPDRDIDWQRVVEYVYR